MAKSPNPRDCYGMLGLAPGASDDEIRQAYRRLAKLWHPDRFHGASTELCEQAERRMRGINEAYHVLGDPERRADFDDQRGYHGNAPVTGIPFDDRPRFFVPGHQFSRAWHAETTDNHGIGTFFGLLFGVIALAAFLGIGSGAGGPQALVGLAVMLVAGACSIASFTNLTSARFGQATSENDDQRAPQTPDEDDPSTTLSAFEMMVQEVLQDLPDEFAATLRNIAIVVSTEPGWSLLRRLGTRPGSTLLGLYEGVPLTQQSAAGSHMPERITLFQGPIERYCLFDPDRIRYQVRATLLHELAHHFGIDHDEMPLWVKA